LFSYDYEQQFSIADDPTTQRLASTVYDVYKYLGDEKFQTLTYNLVIIGRIDSWIYEKLTFEICYQALNIN